MYVGDKKKRTNIFLRPHDFVEHLKDDGGVWEWEWGMVRMGMLLLRLWWTEWWTFVRRYGIPRDSNNAASSFRLIAFTVWYFFSMLCRTDSIGYHQQTIAWIRLPETPDNHVTNHTTKKYGGRHTNPALTSIFSLLRSWTRWHNSLRWATFSSHCSRPALDSCSWAFSIPTSFCSVPTSSFRAAIISDYREPHFFVSQIVES